MFEFMYAKKIKKDIVMEIIDKYKDDYHILIFHKPNGTTEIFIGSKRNESEYTTNLCNRCANKQCAMQSGIYRNDCEFFITKESEEYIENRLKDYNKLLKSGILDCCKDESIDEGREKNEN